MRVRRYAAIFSERIVLAMSAGFFFLWGLGGESRRLRLSWYFLFVLMLGFTACNPDPDPVVAEPPEFAAILYPADNPTTAAGLALGRRLFYETALSADSTVSCATCHAPERGFADANPLSVGIYGRVGRRNSPGLTNIGYNFQTLFWDGRAANLEAQALHPIATPHEMGGDWPTVITRLRGDADYWARFQDAFGLTEKRQLSPDHVGKALAQFQRSLISNDSKYDRVLRGEAEWTPAEEMGYAIFMDLADDPESGFANLPTGECAHCHTPPHFTNGRFFNNGLDEARTLDDFPDPGRGGVTGVVYDNGLFRTPSLRNVALTAPYMHDGRMATLAEVIEHYDSGGRYARNRSPNIFPLHLRPRHQEALTAFLETLTDTSFVNNSAYLPAKK